MMVMVFVLTSHHFSTIFTVRPLLIGGLSRVLQEIGKAIQNAEEDITSEETKIQQGKAQTKLVR